VITGIFEAALRSLLLAVLVWAALRIFRVRNVMYQRLAWSAVLAGALLMPFLLPFTAHWAKFQLAIIPTAAPINRLQAALTPAITSDSSVADRSSISHQASSISAKTAPLHPTHIRPKADAAIIDVNPAQTISPRAASVPVLDLTPPVHSALPHVSIIGFIALAYFLVAAALLARLLLGLVSAMRVWHSATPITFGINVPYEADANLRSSRKVSSPVTIGSGIVLPASYTSWNEEKLRIVLAHERSHVSQHDFHLLILASLYTAVTWFSPLGWWLKHKLSDLGEAISDRSGLNAASNRTAYAQILLEFAAAPRTTLIGVAMARNSNISRRIERLLNDSYLRHAFSASGRARVAVLLVPVVLFAGAALVRVQAATEPAHSAPVFAHVATSSNAVPAQAATLPAQVVQVSAVNATNSIAVLTSPAATAQLDFAMPPQPGELALATPPAPLVPAPAAALANGASEADASFDRNLTFNGQLELSVSTGSGHITITRGSANQVHIHGVVKTNRDGDPAKVQEIAANPPIEQAGNKITIGAHQEHLRNISIDYDIEAPADATLSAATGSGNITDTGVGHDARLDTGSGSINATGLEGGFKAQTGSGNISVDGSGQGDATAQTGSGSIELKGVHGGLKAQTGSGEIKIAGTPSSAWKLETGSGQIELNTGNAPMNLDAETGSGKISTDQPASQTSSDEDHHHYHAQINGGGPNVSAVTGSGRIHVY
jgi:beta-lactamase regulating signal transducer with metallopeptidase domain